jgi:hypothetical protein
MDLIIRARIWTGLLFILLRCEEMELGRRCGVGFKGNLRYECYVNLNFYLLLEITISFFSSFALSFCWIYTSTC